MLSSFLKPGLHHSRERGLGEKHSMCDELINYQKSDAFQSRAVCLKQAPRPEEWQCPHARTHGQTGSPRGLSCTVVSDKGPKKDCVSLAV